MPTYEYACEGCGHEWEAEQSIKDAALTDCPKCNEARAKRQISRGAGFLLKGGGWTGTSTSTRSSTASGVAPGSTSADSAFHERFEQVRAKNPNGDG